MKQWCAVVLAVAVVLVFGQGCASFKDGVSWNMRQSLSRSGGDVSITAVLDSGVQKAAAVEVTETLIAILENEAITLGVFKAKAREAVNPKYADYLDALFEVIPGKLSITDVIPPDVKEMLLSFLRDGSMHGAALYDEAKRPTDD